MTSRATPEPTCARAPQRRDAETFLVLGTPQRDAWRAVLAQAAQYDFHHLPEYHRLAEERGEGTAWLFVYRDGDFTLALPLLLRPAGRIGGGECQDATSVYGYAGPLASHAAMPPRVVAEFHQRLAETLRGRGVVAVFSRLHPLIPAAAALAGLGVCREEGETVSIDLTQPPERQRAGFRAAFKTRINKLRRGGFTVLRDSAKRHLPEFAALYEETMRRVHAHRFYRFDLEYFTKLAGGLGGVLELFVVTLNGAVICGGLFTICAGLVQYHLGATGDAFHQLGPMPLLLDAVRLWAIGEGARVFHLGGGVGAKADSLFHFKAGFSDRRHAFSTWRWVLDLPAYRELCARGAHGISGGEVCGEAADFFPEYRRPALASSLL